jgi:cytosine/adenosine deaminase-related metal-dependent hydrolase
MELTREDVEIARQLEVPMGFHIGVPQGPEPRHSVARLATAGLLGPDMNFAHCCATTDEELRLLYEAGATATACPSIDLAMGMGVPAHGRLRDAGLRPSVGADSVIASTGDLFAEMRLALFCERSRRARAVIESGREVDDVGQLGFTTREALESVTANAAHAIWLEDKVGSLRPGKKADIVLLRASDLNLAPASDLVATIVGSANAGNVDTVFVGGRKVKAAGALVGIDAPQVARRLGATRDRMFRYAGYPGMRPDHDRA